MQADRETNAEIPELAPCPFCGAGETHIHVNKGTWTGMGYGEPVSVEVRHFCETVPGQPSRGIFRVGRDLQSAVDAWNRRAPVPAQAATAEPRDEDEQYTLDRAADLLEDYAQEIKVDVAEVTLEYSVLQEVEMIAKDLRALAAAPVAGQAEDAARLTDEQIEKIAHRRAMRHIPSKDPILRKYVFSLPLLIGFVRAVQQAGQEQQGEEGEN